MKFYRKLANFLVQKFDHRENWIREIRPDEWKDNDFLTYVEADQLRNIIVRKFKSGDKIKIKITLVDMVHEYETNRTWNNQPSIYLNLWLDDYNNLEIDWKFSKNFGTHTFEEFPKMKEKLLSIDKIFSSMRTFVSIIDDDYNFTESDFET